MPRRLTLRPVEMGKKTKLELFVIYSYGGAWEKSWRILQGHELASLFTTISKKVYDQALAGWTRPLMDVLGIQPEGALRKLPLVAQQCETKDRCSMFVANECTPSAKKMPTCFTPGGADAEERQLVSELVRYWREGVYVVVVTQEIEP